MIVVHITRNMKHPRSEVAFSPEEVTIFQDPEKNILYEVFAEFRISVKAIKEAKQRLFIAFKEKAEFLEVALFHLEHQGIIR
jgi:hypothetical protein